MDPYKSLLLRPPLSGHLLRPQMRYVHIISTSNRQTCGWNEKTFLNRGQRGFSLASRHSVPTVLLSETGNVCSPWRSSVQRQWLRKLQHLPERQGHIVNDTMGFLALMRPYRNAFMNLYRLICISLTLPVTSDSCEFSFYGLCRIKNYLQNNSNLALLATKKGLRLWMSSTSLTCVPSITTTSGLCSFENLNGEFEYRFYYCGKLCWLVIVGNCADLVIAFCVSPVSCSLSPLSWLSN